jgi:hypothetical protein
MPREKKNRPSQPSYSSESLMSAAHPLNAGGNMPGTELLLIFLVLFRIAGSPSHPRFIAVIQVRVCGSLGATDPWISGSPSGKPIKIP